MKSNRLYIIGNGFDLFHGIKSKYSDFKAYVKLHDQDLFDTLDKYFDADELWADFEETLAHIDTDTITDDAENFLVSYGADDWSDAYHHDYQYEIQRAINIVTIQLKEHFTNWILHLDISVAPRLALDLDSRYLTFNYTDTLEKVYGVRTANILPIHNKAIDKDSLLILGHSRNPSSTDSFSSDNDEDTDPRVAQGNQILDKYFRDTYKNTQTIIDENRDFFLDLEVDEVFVLGHSISAADIRYFQEVHRAVGPQTKWNVSYYGDKEKMENLKKIRDLGVDESEIKMITFDELVK